MIPAHEVVRVLWFFVPAYLANMSPVLVRGWFESVATPIDGGRTFRGKRILGDHKTWRGLLSALVVGTVVYELQRLANAAELGGGLALIDYCERAVVPGLLMGLGTGIGDAVKSFFKRRVGIAPGATWPIFDQLDFPYSPSLTMSIPISTCLRTTSAVAWRTASAFLDCSNSAGRTRLPTCVVRMRWRLRCMSLSSSSHVTSAVRS